MSQLNLEYTFKVVIAGSRSFDNYELLKEFCDKMLTNKSNVEIVSGGAEGADKLGERYAKERGYEMRIFPANWDRFGNSAGILRNKEMANYANAVIVFWDGVSKGTKNMIEVSKSLNLPLRIKKFAWNAPPHRLDWGEAWAWCGECGAKLYSFDGTEDIPLNCPTPKECRDQR